jgi:hypothetical protein
MAVFLLSLSILCKKLENMSGNYPQKLPALTSALKKAAFNEKSTSIEDVLTLADEFEILVFLNVAFLP